MGKVYSSLVVRPFKNFNVEASAHKFIDKKPKVAPRHESTKEQIDSFVKENRRTLHAEFQVKNEELNKMLNGMVVEVDKFGQIDSKDISKKLPQSRKQSSFPEYGYVEPETIKEGHVSIKQVLELVCKHTDDKNYKVEDIARDYKIAVEDAERIIKYFSMFLLHVPKKLEPKPEPGLISKISKNLDFKRLASGQHQKE